MAWDPQNPPTSADSIDAALLVLPARTAQTEWLQRFRLLHRRGIDVPLKTCLTLVALGHGPDLLDEGDDLCSWTSKADNRGYSVLNPPHNLREEGRKLPSKVVCDLLTDFPDKIRAAVEVQCPGEPDEEEDLPEGAWIGGQSAAFAWVHDIRVLEALRDFGIDLGSLCDDYNCNLLHRCSDTDACVKYPAVVSFICNSIQPPRDLHKLLAKRMNAGDGDKRNAAEHAVLCPAPDKVRDAILAIPGALNRDFYSNKRIQDSDHLELNGAPALLYESLKNAVDAQRTAAELLNQEQILVQTKGAAVHLPLQLVESCEALNVELERWQPAAGVGIGRSSNSGSEGGSTSGGGEGSEAAALAALLLSPLTRATAALTPSQRSVSAGDTAPKVINAFLQVHTAPLDERYMVLNALEINTLLGLFIFADKFLFKGRKSLAAACAQAVRDAVAMPKELGERMLEGMQRQEAGDPAGALLMDNLVPLAVEHFEVTGQSDWLLTLPREVVKRITVDLAAALTNARKRGQQAVDSGGVATESRAKKARLLSLPLDSDFAEP